MGIMVSIKNWVPVVTDQTDPSDIGIQHIATTWEVATDKDFVNIIERREASSDLSTFQSDLTVPTGAVYYVRGYRHMSDPSANLYSNTIVITNKGETSPGILLLEDFYIDTPSIYVDEDELASEGSFEIRCSRFRGTLDAHDYTHWVIIGQDGKTLFTSLYDTVHKLSIVCPIAAEVRSKNNVTILCIHGSFIGIESHPGSYEIGSTESNFEITTNIEELKAYKDNEVTFKAVDASKGIGISMIDLVDGSQNDKIIRTWTNITGSILIPWHESIPGGNMYLRFRFINNVDKAAVIEKPLFFSTKYTSELRHPNAIFLNKLAKPYEKFPEIVMPGSDCITYASFNGDTYLPAKDNNIMLSYLFNYRIDVDGNLKCITANPSMKTEDTIERVHVIDWIGDVKGAYIKHIHGDMLLVDAPNDNGYPTFTFFQKHPNPSYGREYYAIHQTVRENETKSLGYTGGLIQTDNEYILYIPVGSYKIKKYNLRTGEVSDEATIPAEFASDSKNLTMFKLQGQNKVVILGGDDVYTKIYNYETGRFEDSFFITPRTFAGIPLKCVQIQNGDIIIMKATLNPIDQDADIIYYKQGDDKPKVTNLRFDRNSSYPTTIVIRDDVRVDFVSKTDESKMVDNDIEYPNKEFFAVQAFE